MRVYRRFREYRGLLITLYSYTILRGIGRSGYMILYPLYVLSIGYNTSDLGGIATYASLILLPILPMTGYLVDKGWSREILFLSGFSMGLSLIIPVLYPSYISLVVAYSLSYLSLLLFSPSRNRMIGLTIPEAYMGRIYSLFIIVFNSSRIATSFTIGRLTYLGYGYLMLIIGLLSMAGSVIIYIFLIKMFREERVRGLSLAECLSEYRGILGIGRNILPLLLFSLIDSFAWRLWFPMLNAYLKQYKGLTDPEIGDYNTLVGIAMLITAYAAGHLTDILKPIRALAVYEFIGATGVAILLSDKPLIYASSILIGFSIAFWVSAYNTLITLIHGVSRTGRVRALTDTMRSISGVPAPILGGELLLINPTYPYTLSISLMILSVAMLRYIRYSSG